MTATLTRFQWVVAGVADLGDDVCAPAAVRFRGLALTRRYYAPYVSRSRRPEMILA